MSILLWKGDAAGLGGGKMWAMPILCDIGREVWKVKEALVSEEEIPQF